MRKYKYSPRGAIYGSPFVEKMDWNLSIFPNVRTIPGTVATAIKKYKEKPCIRWRNVKKVHHEEVEVSKGVKKVFDIPEFGEANEISFAEWGVSLISVAEGIKKFAGLKKGDRIGIYLETRREWTTFAHACWRNGFVVVTAYPTLGEAGVEKIFIESEITTLFCSRKDLRLLEQIRKNVPNLVNVVYVDDLMPPDEQEPPAQSDEYKLIKFSELEALGNSTDINDSWMTVEDIDPDDCAVIMYTSGTTGDPKGVLLSHGNIVATTKMGVFHAGMEIGEEYLAYLPLAHIMENQFELIVLCTGGTINFGTARTLTDTAAKPHGDLTQWKPSVMLGVPRVWETIRKKIMLKANKSPVGKLLFNTAFSYKRGYVRKDIKTPLTDKIVFKKLKMLFGGNLRIIISGGAPLAYSTHEFIQTALYPETFFIQAFGATETCGAGLGRGPESIAPYRFEGKNPYVSDGTCGFPMIGVEIRLDSVPDMNYTILDEPCERGELLIRGPNVSRGYFKRDQLNKETFSKDGFYRTGDIARRNEDGSISIIDRKKNFMKLSNGEYISPESLEGDYSGSPFVSPNGMIIVANSLSNSVIAVVLPSSEYVCKVWAPEAGIEGKTFKELCMSKELHLAIMEDFKKIAVEKNRLKVERVADMIISDDEWTVENGCLNPTMKLKRNCIKKRYEEVLKEAFKKYTV